MSHSGPAKLSLPEAAVGRRTGPDGDARTRLPLVSLRATEEREELILVLCVHTRPSTPWSNPAGIDGEIQLLLFIIF